MFSFSLVGAVAGEKKWQVKLIFIASSQQFYFGECWDHHRTDLFCQKRTLISSILRNKKTFFVALIYSFVNYLCNSCWQKSHIRGALPPKEYPSSWGNQGWWLLFLFSEIIIEQNLHIQCFNMNINTAKHDSSSNEKVLFVGEST